ncbi:LOB domain-containing protein [Melia azedarach]|uniref:LOB domain-containing protein n=1 Tax=Melia azedarach TaxID=155640 RepID=A0ACC1Z1V3_MELAZ|nr:LOB domain-containing protein [Melia azedarach]
MHKNNHNSGTSVQSACAACKHQRKKCSGECKLARYFPADRNREFQCVHKVFGVSNLTKIIYSVNDEESRQKVVDSLIWEASCRQKDPISGSYGEYKRVLDQLKLCTNQTPMQCQNQNQLVQLPHAGIIYRSSSFTTGWNSGGNGLNMDGIINNNALNYDDGNSIIEMDNYRYAPHNFVPSRRNLKQGREVGPVVVPLQQQQQQQQSGFSQQYYLPGNFKLIGFNVKCKVIID